MAYEIGWGSNHPGYLVWLVDLSQSMNDKIDYVLDSIRESCEALVAINNQKGDDQSRFDIRIIGYNSDVFDLFKENSVIELDKKLDETYPNPIFDKNREAKPQWQTYTANAFKEAANGINKWIERHRYLGTAIPVPIVIHITDGYPFEKDCDPAVARSSALDAANALKKISVPDGNVLLFNMHIGPGVNTIRMPSQKPSDVERGYLYDASSEMPEKFIVKANSLGFSEAKKGSRFMVSNETDKRMLTRLIIFGSTGPNNLNVELPKP